MNLHHLTRHVLDGRRQPGFWVIALICLFWSQSSWALHPNQPQGFDPSRSYQQNQDNIDQVDLFSGRLSVTLPIGPFTLIYNNNVWRYQPWPETGGGVGIRATPDEQSTAGLGWYLGWGEVYAPNHWYNNSGRWLYVDGQGGRHTFYQDLHQELPNDGDNKVLYTRDGSYLRLRLPASGHTWTQIEFPNGMTRHFVSNSGGLGGTYNLSKVWNRFGSQNDPDISITYQDDDTLRTMTDRYGRTHYVHLDADQPWTHRTITQIDVEAFDGQRAIYDFDYIVRPLRVSCKDTSGSTGLTVSVPHLVGIDLPDGTRYSMEEGGQPLYHNLCSNGIDDLPGSLQGIDLPTGGKIRWQYQEYEFPPGEENDVFNSSAGVSRRTLYHADDTEYGAWTYRTTDVGVTPDDDPEMITEVVYPTGDCSKHYFNARYTQDPGQGLGWERGLPFVYRQQSDGFNLSSETYETSANGACTGDPLRSRYLKFRRDTPPGSTQFPADWYNTNRQMEGSRTVYHDDNDRYQEVTYHDFDGLGHFRRREQRGDFWEDSSNDELRVQTTHYNRTAGSYPNDYQPPTVTTPWVLGIYDYVENTAADSVGPSQSRVEYGFDASTGVMQCRRTLASGTSRSTDDVVVQYSRNDRGLVTDVKQFGGDLQSVSLSADCNDVGSTPDYWTTHTFQSGVLATSRALTPQGAPAPYFLYDVDIDPGSGYVAASRDSTGFEVIYDYDAMGRIVSMTPEEGAFTVFDFINADGNDGARRHATTFDGSEEVHRREIVLDGFGRPRLDRRRLPGEEWSEKETQRNARGWITSVSEQGRLSKTTQFLDFDPFGRARTIRPPDGEVHDLTFTFEGARKVTSNAKVAMAGGETIVQRSNEKDRYGRLRTVLEPSGPGGTMTPTNYSYDVGSRLTRIVTGSDGGTQQVRAFNYDNRGFMLTETMPEKGINGNGTVYHEDFDSMGRAHTVIDGPNRVERVYDPFGRLLELRDGNQNSRLLTEYHYDNALGWGLGRVHEAIRHNYLTLPFNVNSPSTGEEDVAVKTIYSYQGPGGAISRQKTRFSWSLQDITFQQDYSYNGSGNITSQTYPFCIAFQCDGTVAATSPQLTYTWDEGKMTGVEGWVDSIEYNSAGKVKRLYHANGVVDHRTIDPNFTRRTQRIFTTGATPTSANFDSESFTFDGTGNIKTMGSSASFTYDAVGRLQSSQQQDAGCTNCTVQQDFTYDTFGNLTSRQTNQSPFPETWTIDASSNRITGIPGSTRPWPLQPYDAAGNFKGHWGNYVYDPLNRLVSQGDRLFVYDSAGERVARIENSASINIRFQLRGLQKQLLSNIDFDGQNYSRSRDLIFAGGRLVAAASGNGQTLHHYHLDHLGSPRLLTLADGSAVAENTFLPFGEEAGTPSLLDDLKLGGHERDASSALDYLHARQYTHELGRFTAVDPVRGAADKPQRLNRYAFAMNNPIRYGDPDGRNPIEDDAVDTFVREQCVGKGSTCEILWHIRVKTHDASEAVDKGGWMLANELWDRVPVLKRLSGWPFYIKPHKRPEFDVLMFEEITVVGAPPEKLEKLPLNWPPFEPVNIDLSGNGTDEGNDGSSSENGGTNGGTQTNGETGGTTTEGTTQGTEPEATGVEKPTPEEILRADWSLRELYNFSCMMSPTTCYRGSGGGGSGSHYYWQAY